MMIGTGCDGGIVSAAIGGENCAYAASKYLKVIDMPYLKDMVYLKC